MIGRTHTRGSFAFLVIATPLLLLCLGVSGASAQPAGPGSGDALRAQVLRRFDVVPLQKGIALVPKSPSAKVKLIQLSGDEITVDGAAVSGGELRRMLGGDADLVLRLSYLEPEARRELLQPATAPPVPPAAPEPPGAGPAPPEPPAPPRHRRQSDVRLRIGGNVTVGEDESTEDVVVIGGSADVLGQVRGSVVVIGGAVYLGPHADVTQDVTIVGGVLKRDPGAVVGGKLNEIGVGAIDLSGLRFGRIVAPHLFGYGSSRVSAFALFSTLTRFVILCVLATLVVLIAHGPVERISARAAAEPVKAGVIGVLAQLMILPIMIVTIVLLVVTIVGIPLLALVPFALLGLCVVFLVGFTAVAYNLGQIVRARMGWSGLSPYATANVGVLVVMTPALLARILGLGGAVMFPMTVLLLMLAVLVEYLAWTIGFGAAALVRFDRRTAAPVAPPAAPSAA